jgi:hypothetical protein
MERGVAIGGEEGAGKQGGGWGRAPGPERAAGRGKYAGEKQEGDEYSPVPLGAPRDPLNIPPSMKQVKTSSQTSPSSIPWFSWSRSVASLSCARVATGAVSTAISQRHGRR